jgi:SAM-dependent methyltransferase
MRDSAAQQESARLIERLNTSWRLDGSGLAERSLKSRLVDPLRKLLARILSTQETFNSTVVQYVNTSVRPLETSLAQYDGMIDEVRRFREALAARERRMEDAMSAMRGQHEELQTALGVLQQATRTLARDTAPPPSAGAASRGPAQEAVGPAGPEPPAHALSHAYVGFEDAFRGSADQITARLAGYVTIFQGGADVLDLGCGRGEFLELLAQHGITGRGVDLNESMVDVCRARGLTAAQGDALSYLRSVPDGSLGGLFAAQVVEHLEPAYLTQLLASAFDKLRPGSPIVLETINPACWFAFFESYIRDITHVRPLHPDTLKFLLVASGFQNVDIRYSAPYPEHDKLQPVSAPPPLADVAETLNANVEKLNRLLFTYLDYAAVGRRI